jgi:hypothetical protein
MTRCIIPTIIAAAVLLGCDSTPTLTPRDACEPADLVIPEAAGVGLSTFAKIVNGCADLKGAADLALEVSLYVAPIDAATWRLGLGFEVDAPEALVDCLRDAVVDLGGAMP